MYYIFWVFFLLHLRFTFILYVLSFITMLLDKDLFLFILLLPRVNFQSENLGFSFALEDSQPLFLYQATYVASLSFFLFSFSGTHVIRM